jgi:dipeptidyl aminopeptidase/acylaminoacyl peptidase
MLVGTGYSLITLAEEGYVVIAPNISKSRSYGQELTDAIRGS